ncbi:MAG TPA: hypothetical protein P5201_07935, partial [Aminobacteriaceae bacterium]|nr:hypothetical protein [Aminobacteriaceae bacterium]
AVRRDVSEEARLFPDCSRVHLVSLQEMKFPIEEFTALYQLLSDLSKNLFFRSFPAHSPHVRFSRKTAATN